MPYEERKGGREMPKTDLDLFMSSLYGDVIYLSQDREKITAMHSDTDVFLLYSVVARSIVLLNFKCI